MTGTTMTGTLRMTQTLEPISGPAPIDPRSRLQGAKGADEFGTLWLIAVPIGNLEDITLRALRLLRTVPLVACEDTRTTRQLLKLLDVAPPRLISCHEHNERGRSVEVIEHLAKGLDVALVSDAGTPSVSDPGYPVVTKVIEAGYAVSSIPGPCAAISALCASGLPTHRFRFIGFLSAKAGSRRKQLTELVTAQETLIFYESPHRLDKFLSDAAEILGGTRKGVVARELTKRYEEFRRGTLQQLAEHPGVNRGEVVVLIDGQSEEEKIASTDINALIAEVRALDRSPSATAKELSKRSHLTRKEAYDLLRSQDSDPK
jgi:16S rRNA (cytidine1402-2'-O)-methyltransferase